MEVERFTEDRGQSSTDNSIRVGSTGREYVGFNLIRISQPIHLVKQPNYGQHFSQTFVVKPQPLHGGGVRVNSVRTTVGDGDSQRDDLFGQQVNFAWPHDRLEPGPAQLQVFRVSRQRPPDIRDAVDFLGGHNVVKDSPDFWMIGVFVHEFHGAHFILPMKIYLLQSPEWLSVGLKFRRLHKSSQDLL